MSDRAAWTAFLDSLESELHAVERTGAARLRARTEFLPPDDLGPLPRELADRARSTLAALAGAAEVVRAEMRNTARQLDELRQMDPRGPRPPSSFDHRA